MHPVSTITQTLPFSFDLGDGITLSFYLLAAIYVVFTGIFYYHWQQYGSDKNVTWITLAAYFATTLPLMAILGILTLLI